MAMGVWAEMHACSLCDEAGATAGEGVGVAKKQGGEVKKVGEKTENQFLFGVCCYEYSLFLLLVHSQHARGGGGMAGATTPASSGCSA